MAIDDLYGTYTNTTATSIGDTTWTTWNTAATALYYQSQATWTTWASAGTNVAVYGGLLGQQQGGLGNYQQAGLGGYRGPAAQDPYLHAPYGNPATPAVDKESETRAKELLCANLTDEQKAEFDKTQYFTVISRDGQRRYRINKGWSHNVEVLDTKGKKTATLCAHLVDTDLPPWDNVLAQKLYLEHAEPEFLKVANRLAAA